MQRLKIFFKHPTVKAAVIGALTACFGVLCNWTVGSDKWWKWLIFVAFIIINIVVLCAYANAEKSSEQEVNEIKTQLNDANNHIRNLNNQIRDLEDTNKVFSSAMQGITNICKCSSKDVNVQIHDIIETAHINPNKWNFDAASKNVCESIYENIIKTINMPKSNSGIVDVEIGYVKLVEEECEKNKKYINLCGYYHPSRSPAICGKNRLVKGGAYHDASLFKLGSDQPDIRLNASSIKEVFKGGNCKDYSQCLGIPVFCPAHNNTSKMVGLLQIVCHGDSILAKDEDEMKIFANYFFTPYAYMFLLLYKIDKALRAQPKLAQSKPA